ncbi:MAG: hypothetical protein VB050_10190 [Geobacteraceae bacterium]|nr:hypothetical protein [Geobacteraceae bacterium]
MEEPSRSFSRLSGRGDSFRGSLIVASNREPYSHRKTGSDLELQMSAGGLVKEERYSRYGPAEHATRVKQ